jgi:hypothetical protein
MRGASYTGAWCVTVMRDDALLIRVGAVVRCLVCREVVILTSLRGVSLCGAWCVIHGKMARHGLSKRRG